MNDIYGITFDLDGAICSTDNFHYLAWQALAQRLRIPFDEQVNSRLRGVSRMKSLGTSSHLGRSSLYFTYVF